MTYIRRERDWVERAAAAGRPVTPTRLLPMLPAAIAAQVRADGNGHGNGHGNGNGHAPALTAGHGSPAAPAIGPGESGQARPRARLSPTAVPDPRHDPDHRHPLGRRPVRHPLGDDAR